MKKIRVINIKTGEEVKKRPVLTCFKANDKPILDYRDVEKQFIVEGISLCGKYFIGTFYLDTYSQLYKKEIDDTKYKIEVEG